MKKSVFCFLFVFGTFISAKVPEDICESCVPRSKCARFTSISRTEQESWMQKYPCNNYHPDDYGNRPGTKPSQGDFICCPNQIWGVEHKEPLAQRTDNQFGSSQNSPGFSGQSRYPSYGNVRINKNNNSRDTNLSNDKQWNSQNPGSSNQNTPKTNLEPSKWPNYWNQRPDRNAWDIGNPNSYHGNNNRRLFTNRRNHHDSDQKAETNQGVRTNQPNGRPKGQGYERNDNDNQYPNYPNNRQPGDTASQSGQCDRLTSFPPDPQSGCCGREATDDYRITGNAFYFFGHIYVGPKAPLLDDSDSPTYDYIAPAYNNRGWDRYQEPIYEWPYSMFKEGANNKAVNKTVSLVSGTGNVNSTVAVERRISGGKETELTQFPWTALLLATFQNNNQITAFNCGGSLISSKFVLTAGHCVSDAESALKSVEVFLAEFDKRTFPRDCKITAEGRKCIDNIAIYSEDVVVHPSFDETRLRNDIALIKLQKDAPYTEYIRPICLPSINIDHPEHNHLPLTVAGWGRNGQYKTDIKQSTTVHLVPQHDCKKYYPDLTTRHLCAAGYSGEDTCKGDSGGPLMVLYQKKYYVVGVVSGKRTDTPCGSRVPSLYTNVYHYLDWIRSKIGN